MIEWEKIIDDISKQRIVKEVTEKRKDISEAFRRADKEVYLAAVEKIKQYRRAYWINIAVPPPDWYKYAKILMDWPSLRSSPTNILKIAQNINSLENKYKRTASWIRASRAVKPFDDLIYEIEKTNIPNLSWWRAWNIGPNIDRVADRINKAEERVRPVAQKEVAQQETQKLANESARTLAGKRNAWTPTNERVAPKQYMERVWNYFKFTKDSNPEKIQDVMSAFIQRNPGAVYLLDYNGCTNDNLKTNIKRRTKNWSWKVYIKYNPKIKTFDFWDGTTKEPLWGKRPYIWEGVTLITKEVEWLVAQKNEQDRLDASTNVNYENLANQGLERNFGWQIKILKDIKISGNISFWDEIKSGKWNNKTYPNRARDFLVCVETRLNDVVKKWRTSARLDKKDPIDTGWWLLQVRLITSTGDLTKVPLFVNDEARWAARWWLPTYLYNYISNRKSETQQYLTQRLYERWWELEHMERRDKVVNFERQTVSTNENERKRQEEIIKEKKELKLYWVSKLWEVLDSLEKDSHMTEELGPLLTHIEGIKKDLENSPKNSLPSNSTWAAAIKKTQDLYINYKNHDGSWATITDGTAKKLIEQIFNAKSRTEVQNAVAQLWNWMTLFDNTSRSWVVSDYFEDATEWNQSYYKNGWKNKKDLLEINDKENKWYNECFQNICKLTYVDVDEKTGEISGPQENVDFIDSLMGCYTQADLTKFFKDKKIIPDELENEDSKKYEEICTTILKTLDNKRDMVREFELTASDMKKSYEAEINELKKKTTLSDEEMARMALLMCMIEDDAGLEESAKEQTKVGKDAIRYGWVDSLLHEHISSYLVKKWGGLKWGDVSMSDTYNDSKWLRWRWDRTDENCEKIWPILKEILIEVVITAVAIWLWVVTWGLWVAAVAWLKASAVWVRAINIWNKVAKFTRIAKLCKKMGTASKYCTKLKNTAKLKMWWKVKNTRLWNAYSRVRGASGTRVVGENLAKNTWRTMATITSETRVWRTVAHAAEWTKWTKLWKAGKSVWDIVKAWNIARTEWRLWMKAVWMIFEWTWFHVASTALHNAIEGRDILADLNPVDNFRWYVQSIAFLWMLKFLWKPINTMTSTSMEFVMWQKISATQFWNAVKYVAWLTGEFWSLVATDEALSIAFDWKFKGMTVEEAIHSIGMILWLRLHWKIKQLKSITIKEYDKARSELKVDLWEGVITLRENEILHDSEYNPYYNWYKKTPELTKLGSQYKWMERQSKFNEEYNQAKDVIQKLPESLRTETMKKFLETWDMMEFSPHDIKTIQREIWLKWKEVDWVLGPKSLKRLREYVSKNGWGSEVLNDRVVDRATQKLHEKFDQEIMSENWITIDWITYKLERRPNEWHNPNRKWRIVYTETWPDWKIKVKIEANSDTFVLPENSNWNRIRERFNSARGKYVKRNLNSTLESARNDLDWEFSRDIDLKSKDLEWRRKDRAVLEWKKKNLSDEVDGLKSRKAQLEQQLQNISKELTIQPNIVSLKDIYSIIKEGNIVSIWWKKMKFIWVKWDKIVFTEWKWKTREFSSFKELQDAKANFNFDIKNRQSERWLEQQIMFEELVWKEARTKNANEIIREYESLQRQKTQIEQDIRDWFFRENAIKLKWKHIWIDGIEYQCTDIKTNNGRTTLDFKKTDWSDSFTISSFEQLKAKWQVNGFWDRYDVIDKETRAAWRDLSRHERGNHELLRGENWLFKWGNKYVENKRQLLQQVEQQLKDGRANYDNAKLATSPKRVPNPEYERIQKEIEWIDAQLIEKWQELANVERNLWASDTDISKLEQEIVSLKAQKDNLFKWEWWEVREWWEVDPIWEQREKLKTREEKAQFLHDNFHMETHGREAEFQSFTKEQISILKQLKDLWFSLSLWDVAVKYAKLKPEEVNTLKQLKDLWVNLLSYTEELSKLKPEEVNTLKQLKDLWVDLSFNVLELSKLKFEQINLLKELKDLWIDISDSTLQLSELKPEQINLLKDLKDLWIDISEVFPLYWRELISYKPEEITKLKQLKDLWIDVWEDINLCLSIELTEANSAIIKLLWENWKVLLNPHEVFDSWGLIDALKELKGKWIDIENILAFESKVKYEEYWIQKSEIESYNNYNRWKIIENIETYVQKIIWEKRNIWVAEILNSVRVDILTLPKQERMYFMKGISNIVEKFNTVRKYIDFKNGPYKTPKELLLAMRWINDPNIIAKITDDITVRQHGTWLHFFVWDKTSYEIIYHKTLDIEWKKESGWFNTGASKIKELEWTLSVWNWKDPGLNKGIYEYGTILHEWQHNRNSYFMRDKNQWTITYAKDEITAYLRDGRWIFKPEKRWETIEKILTTPASEKWLYQYNLEWEAWEAHKQKVRELLKYANDLIELTRNPDTWMTREKVISLLSDVPAEWWKDLHSNIMEAVALHNQTTQTPEKIKSLRWRFVEKIKEWSNKVKLVRDLANWWNSKFSNYKIDLDGPEFWRTGNAKKENIVSEITTAKSIDEIKHILNNPKYSHISWWKNNKSWMEISAIVDDVIVGKYAISYLPSEIRNTVKKFMN